MAREVHDFHHPLQHRPRLKKEFTGVVRKQLGLSFLGESRDASEKMTMGDVHLDGVDRSVCLIPLPNDYLCRLIK